MKLLLRFCLVLMSTNLYGYDYVRDLLYYEDDTLMIYQIPLEDDFISLLKTESINYDEGSHMKCLDGFRIWELRNDSLFLKKLLNCRGDELLNRDSSSLLVAEYKTSEVFADWVTSKLYNQYGTLLHQVSGHSIYEFDREFEVHQGKLQQVVNYDNRASSTSIYHSEIDSLYDYLHKAIDWKLLQAYNCDLDKTVIINFTLSDDRQPEKLKVLRGLGEDCNYEIVKAIKGIPDWNIYYQRGKPIHVKWNLPVDLQKLSQY